MPRQSSHTDLCKDEKSVRERGVKNQRDSPAVAMCPIRDITHHCFPMGAERDKQLAVPH